MSTEFKAGNNLIPQDRDASVYHKADQIVFPGPGEPNPHTLPAPDSIALNGVEPSEPTA